MQLQAPRLQYGNYATWRPNMDVYLQRNGAEGIHKRKSTEKEWIDINDQVNGWADEALEAALSLTLSTSSSTSSNSSKVTITDEVKTARTLVSTTVERSRKVFGILYSSLPDDLRIQVAHIAQGWAFGLWDWLEKKFQSTEEDNVGTLLAQWTMLQQLEEESFDAYRARVNRLSTLLEQAKEKPSARMYSYILMDRLQPRYKQAVLALKASGQLKDADKIGWEEVTAFINSHERNEQRIGNGGEMMNEVSSGSEDKAMVIEEEDGTLIMHLLLHLLLHPHLAM